MTTYALGRGRRPMGADVEPDPLEALERLVIDKATMTPAEISPDNTARLGFRRATDEQDPVPKFEDVLPDWRS